MSDKRSGPGRPSIYTPEVAEEICERLANGESLVQICQTDGLPSMRTVLKWAKENADFSAEYVRAREAQAEHMDHLILDAAKTANAVNAPAQRVKVDAYKWRAAKLAPKVYGDKSEVTHRGVVATAATDLPTDPNEAARAYRDLVEGVDRG